MWTYDSWSWSWIWPFHFIIPILFWILVIAAIVMLVRYAMGREMRMPADRRSPGLDVLEERYARGEISREEYHQKKQDILG